ncbi:MULTISPECIES: hypothetical protein [Paenarthrobacter]|uniref:Uncharacterized protein n=1 Tax=Paenarthrobacter ureafaciens TaxID=37931 RepID=A0AAX3EQQ5_PAEUR|nr:MULTISPECIES: hypothetical protein [Paenarthrobacter]MDO5867064.1 hypothetical protein [Paenarthrobacter sp. SD-2]MDO5878232.1 hypothetical protein [Paenarthrobacter sp. SD-1]UYV95554.1 hypothetical protein NL395_23045 [Paenarthrobacter ureafaciens]UYW00154.1 hypothetical protein NL394_23430 [Paenarthrobacter ureafaciens]
MRTFIHTNYGETKYIDAATITDITVTGANGGVVRVITPSGDKGHDPEISNTANRGGHAVAVLGAAPKRDNHGTEKTSAEERAARKNQAAVLAEHLIHAICRAEAIAKREGNGAVIRFDPENAKWTITDLGKTATSPGYA